MDEDAEFHALLKKEMSKLLLLDRKTKKNEPNTLLFLNTAFPFLSPYYHLTYKRDVLLEFIFEHCVACCGDSSFSLRLYFEYLVDQSQFKRREGSTLDCEVKPCYHTLTLINEAKNDFDGVVFRILAVLSYFQRPSLDVEELSADLNVCTYYFLFDF